ncbi:hypothetical protein ACFLWS_07930 [Chloroflexota bacterium]
MPEAIDGRDYPSAEKVFRQPETESTLCFHERTRILGDAVYGSHVEDYLRASKEKPTTRYHGYIIVDKSDKGQDASWRIEVGNPSEID